MVVDVCETGRCHIVEVGGENEVFHVFVTSPNAEPVARRNKFVEPLPVKIVQVGAIGLLNEPTKKGRRNRREAQALECGRHRTVSLVG